MNQYREVLKENSINPNVEAINKILRQHESGKPAKFHQLLNALIKNKSKKSFDLSNANYILID